MCDLSRKCRLSVVNLITTAALVCGCVSIIAAARENLYLAAQLIMAGMILDGLDGTFARLLKAESPFGAELDTFVDITCFGVAPALLVYFASLHTCGAWGIILTTAIIMSGAMRLARFKVVDTDHGMGGYTGMPITANAGLLALIVLLDQSPIWENPVAAWQVRPAWFNITEGPFAWAFWINCAIGLLLQVSTFRYGKLTAHPVGQAIGVVMFLGLFITPMTAFIATVFWLLPLGLYFQYLQPFVTAYCSKRSKQ